MRVSCIPPRACRVSRNEDREMRGSQLKKKAASNKECVFIESMLNNCMYIRAHCVHPISSKNALIRWRTRQSCGVSAKAFGVWGLERPVLRSSAGQMRASDSRIPAPRNLAAQGAACAARACAQVSLLVIAPWVTAPQIRDCKLF